MQQKRTPLHSDSFYFAAREFFLPLHLRHFGSKPHTELRLSSQFAGKSLHIVDRHANCQYFLTIIPNRSLYQTFSGHFLFDRRLNLFHPRYSVPAKFFDFAGCFISRGSLRGNSAIALAAGGPCLTHPETAAKVSHSRRGFHRESGNDQERARKVLEPEW